MSDAPLVHVVDDDDSLRTALLRLLGAAGCEARGYASAGDFRLQPLPDRPGCLLLDLNMPGGLAVSSCRPLCGARALPCRWSFSLAMRMWRRVCGRCKRARWIF